MVIVHRHFLEGAQRVCGVHQRRSAAHVHRHAERFIELCARRSELDKALYVEANTGIAVGGDAERQRDQFLRLLVERPVTRGSLRQRAEAFHDIRHVAAEFGELSGHVLRNFTVTFVHDCMP